MRSEPFDDGDVRGAAALAHGLQAVAATGALQLVQHGRKELGARCAQRMTKLVHELERAGRRFGLQTMCEGGGQANAMVIERV